MSKMLQNNDKMEEKGSVLSPGWWDWGCARGTISLPRAGGRRGNNGRELADISHLDTASRMGKTLQKTSNLSRTSQCFEAFGSHSLFLFVEVCL